MQAVKQVAGRHRRLSQIAGRHVSRPAMHPGGQPGRSEDVVALRQQRRDHAREHIPRAGRGHAGIARHVARVPATSGEERARPLEYDQRVERRGHLGGGLLQKRTVARLRPTRIAAQESQHLSSMRREHPRTGVIPQHARRRGGERPQRIGIEYGGGGDLPPDPQHQIADRDGSAHAGPHRHGVGRRHPIQHRGGRVRGEHAISRRQTVRHQAGIESRGDGGNRLRHEEFDESRATAQRRHRGQRRRSRHARSAPHHDDAAIIPLAGRRVARHESRKVRRWRRRCHGGGTREAPPIRPAPRARVRRRPKVSKPQAKPPAAPARRPPRPLP